MVLSMTSCWLENYSLELILYMKNISLSEWLCLTSRSPIDNVERGGYSNEQCIDIDDKYGVTNTLFLTNIGFMTAAGY